MPNQFQITGFSKVVQFDTSNAKSTKCAKTKQLQFTAKCEYSGKFTIRSISKSHETMSLVDVCHRAFIELFSEYPVSSTIAIQTNSLGDYSNLIVIIVTGKTNQIG
jgi:hypothetical protein